MEYVFGSILEGTGVHFPKSLNLRLITALMFVFGMTIGVAKGLSKGGIF